MSARRIPLFAVGTRLLLLLLASAAVALALWQPEGLRWRNPGVQRWIQAGSAVLGYLLLIMAGRWRRRDRVARAQRDDDCDDAVLVIHSSQSGHAVQLAQRTAAALQAAGRSASVVAIDALDAARLIRTRRALWIASTTGDGDPPDGALRFIRSVMAQPLSMATLEYGVLALGDRRYPQFCAWGRQLDQWLRERGAQALFERIDVDDADAAALERWHQQLSRLADGDPLDGWQAPPLREWQLVERRLLNAGSSGAPCFHVALVPVGGGGADWQAGDVFALQLPGDSRVQRDYSIASLPADGAVHLLVRQTRRDDGSLGLGSGWLTQHGAIGDRLPAQIRANPRFHLPDDARPLILIGNGTGLAGLRALLKARIARGHDDNWLLFGERHAAYDVHYRAELMQWQAQGALRQLDLVFSRDGDSVEYVQHRLLRDAALLRDRVQRGAAIYVCGSAHGMATGVDEVLRRVLGHDGIEQLIESGRYRRDVY